MIFRIVNYRSILIDIDECVEQKNACGSGNCTNSVGSFSCKCEAGYKPADDSPTCVGMYMLVWPSAYGCLPYKLPLHSVV